MRIGHHEEVDEFHALLGVGNTGDRVAAVAEHHHRLDGRALVDLLLGQERRIEPPGRGDAGGLHVLLGRAGRTAALGGDLVEARQQPVVLDLPDAGPVLPGAFDEAVIERQGRDIEAQIRRALHVGVAAEDVGARARRADIAGGEKQDAVGPHVGRAHRVLGGAHAPDQGRRLLLGEGLGHAPHLVAGNTRHVLDGPRIPLLDFLADLVHAVDPLGDEVLVLPAVLEDVVEHAPNERDVRAWA
jgi:hypothetical protein